MPLHKHVVTQVEQGTRLDVLLSGLEGVASRSAAVKLIEQGDVTLNEQTVTKKHIVVAGDRITYRLEPPQPLGLIAEQIPLDIRYEDADLIVLSKQAGLVCHPAHGHESGTLVNALIAHCGYGNLAQLQGDDRPGIVHRLDKDTSGLMLVAKTDEAGLLLQDGIRSKAIDRRYLALVHGPIASDTGLIDAPLARGTTDRQRMVVSDAPTSKPSVTTFSVLERFEAGRFDDGFTLIECKLFTGRTHQIRVHLDYINHPCVGDPLYGSSNRPKAQLGLDRQFLHSYKLEFTHPLTGEELLFTDPLPADLQAALAQIESKSLARGKQQ
ncbi:MAG: RluA family pseudouridine synthase [Coriobacteriia bacterium]|nr:RluA family pseudouridine synthase [Coriobacteriia bacterium]